MTYKKAQFFDRKMHIKVKQRQRKSGFALIASLTLMMLLGLIAVGVLSIASTQNRLAAHAVIQVEARQQALIGLDAALAEMQSMLGPDQRVTASSGILSEEKNMPQHILGVWDSWKKPLYSKREGSIQNTYTPGRRSQFLRWLISSRTPNELKELDSVQNLGKRNPGFRICLVGEGSLGRNASADEYIYADLVDMPASNKNTASYAWWVSGENQKVNATIKEKAQSKNEVDILNRTWDTPAPSFAESSKLSFLELSEEDKEKQFTQDCLTLPSGDVNNKGVCFFDVTNYSYSLPVNVRDGGFKHDLNMLLDKESLRGTPYAPRTDQDCPLAENDDIPAPSSSESNMPIGSWQVMHAYHNTWPDGTGKGDQEFCARLCGSSVKDAYTRMSGNLEQTTIHHPGSEGDSGSDAVTIYDTRAISGDSRAGYARTPVMLAFLGAHGLAIGTPQSGSIPNSYSFGLAYAPYVQWWNPYNVRMRVGAKKLWTYSLPYRTSSVLILNESKWSRWIMLQPQQNKQIDWQNGGAAGQRNSYGNDWGNYFANTKDDTNDIVFEPGEILVFSMAEVFNNLNYEMEHGLSSNSDMSYTQPQAVPFTLGDSGGVLNNYFISLYSYGSHFGEALALSFETSSLYSEAVANGWIKTRIDEAYDGRDSNFFYLYDVVGDLLGPQAREMFCVVHGFDGIDASEKKNQGILESKRSSRVDRFFGARGISPNHFAMGWFDYDTASSEDMWFCGVKEGYTWNRNMQIYEPVYFSAVGIIPKSFNPSAQELFALFKDKDYRTKVWQHSNPALGASALYKPDDQERQYNPYQLAGLEMGTGLGRGSLDTIGNRNGVYGTTSAGSGGGEAVSFLSVLELPLHPPFSLAGFAGMRLTPGWYRQNDTQDSIAEMRRLQYQAGVPGVGIGNSFADPCLPSNDVHTFHETRYNSLGGKHKNVFSEFYDHALLINDALWDRWFCSSIARMPHSAEGTRSADKTLRAFIENGEDLPVSRYKKNMQGLKSEQVLKKLLATDGWMHIARYLWIEGGFNINSISEEAWAATLQGLAKRDLLTNAGGTLRKIDKKSSGDVLFSRFMVSTAQQPIDSYGYDPVQGSSTIRPGLNMTTAWGEVRSLTSEDIHKLAREIVKKVRERGPFLNMSDFINRRLDGGTNHALTGALQAAIDATDINQAFNADAYKVKVQKTGSLYKFLNAAEGSMYTAAPGYLIQSDVLASLGNILTVRDDTFIVRAYGCVRNAHRAVLAQAWCEATVQRTADYMDANANDPEDNDRTDAAGQSKATKPLTEINRIMGRKLRIVSFKWLDSWDI